MAQWLINPTKKPFDPWPCSVGQESGIAASCSVGHRCGLDPALLLLWRRPAATALIRPLAWEPPCAVGAVLEKAKRQKKMCIFLSFRSLCLGV